MILAMTGVLGASLGAMLYMYGALLGRDKFKETARKMVWDIAFTVAFVLVLTTPLTLLSSEIVRNIDPVGASVYCTSPSIPDFCATDVAKGYFTTLNIEAATALREIFKYYGIVKVLESFSLQVNEQNLARQVKPLEANTSLFMLMFEKIISMLKLVLTVTAMQMFIFDFFTNPGVFTGLLVFGTMARIFPPTKKLGGLLMALALVMFFFFPVLVALPDAVYFTYPQNSQTQTRLNLFYSSGFLSFGVSSPPNTRPLPINPGNPSTFSPSNVENEVEDATSNYEDLSYENAKNYANQQPPTVGKTINWARTLSAVLAPLLPALTYKTVSSVAALVGGAVAGLPLPDSWIGAAASIVGGVAGLAVGGFAAKFVIDSVHLSYLMIVSSTEVVATFLIFSGLFSYAILIAAIGAIKSLSQFLGGDIEIAGLTKFI